MRIDENGNAWWHWLLGGLLVLAITVVTAGVAGIAAAGIGAALGVGTSLVNGAVIGAAIGGLIVGGSELIGQGIETNWQTLDFGALAIETFTGAAYGAIAGVAGSTTSAGLRLGMRAARVGLSGLNALLHGINNGDSFSSILLNTAISIGGAIIIQGGLYGVDYLRGYTTTINIMAIAMDKIIKYGIKEMIVTGGVLTGRHIWRFFKEDIIYIGKRMFGLI